MRELDKALRQYRHNNGGDFVFAYDKQEVDRIVASLTAALTAVEQDHEHGPGLTISEHTLGLVQAALQGEGK